MPYLSMKLPNQHGDIVTIKADQVEARECYTKSLLDKPYTLTSSKHTDAADANHEVEYEPWLFQETLRRSNPNIDFFKQRLGGQIQKSTFSSNI
ncbi:hypothetical protein JHK87_004629 [Glycine soja]|nr:hypothetical protein JHK87_004629 [Glycine soja]